MIDIKLIRENPDLVKENIRKKFQDYKLCLVDEILELDKKNREVKLNGDGLRMNRNSLSNQIGLLMRNGKKDEAEAIRKIKNKEIKGFIIKVIRNLSSSENYTHESETVDVDYDFLIENNKSTMELYYKVISIVSGIKKNLM